MLIFQEESKKRENGNHLLPTKVEVRETKLSTIYSLYQEKEETDVPPSKLKMVAKDVKKEEKKDMANEAKE